MAIDGKEVRIYLYLRIALFIAMAGWLFTRKIHDTPVVHWLGSAVFGEFGNFLASGVYQVWYRWFRKDKFTYSAVSTKPPSDNDIEGQQERIVQCKHRGVRFIQERIYIFAILGALGGVILSVSGIMICLYATERAGIELVFATASMFSNVMGILLLYGY